MTNAIPINIARFIGLLILQVMVMKPISWGWEGQVFINVIVYPLFIILLPLRTPMPAALLSAFAMGLLVDAAYNSWGVHAATSVLTAYLRPLPLKWMQPRDGYNVNHSPTKKRMGVQWFLIYASIVMAFHLFVLYNLDAFSLVFFKTILQKTLTSFPLSMFFIIIIMYIFNPED
ncbi:MAG: hypothetical protein KDD19_00705 [Phaeodactylibacter sp.]|nr:hypothetical protein [Phaeodactylibacter sp.]MCB9053821.1 hypothetical protein [Lewinellaceae bacterium]